MKKLYDPETKYQITKWIGDKIEFLKTKHNVCRFLTSVELYA